MIEWAVMACRLFATSKSRLAIIIPFCYAGKNVDGYERKLPFYSYSRRWGALPKCTLIPVPPPVVTIKIYLAACFRFITKATLLRLMRRHQLNGEMKIE